MTIKEVETRVGRCKQEAVYTTTESFTCTESFSPSSFSSAVRLANRGLPCSDNIRYIDSRFSRASSASFFIPWASATFLSARRKSSFESSTNAAFKYSAASAGS